MSASSVFYADWVSRSKLVEEDGLAQVLSDVSKLSWQVGIASAGSPGACMTQDEIDSYELPAEEIAQWSAFSGGEGVAKMECDNGGSSS